MSTENICYLGNTARLPYGTKSAATINRYALRISRQSLIHNVKALVVACHGYSLMAASPAAVKAMVAACHSASAYALRR